MSTTTLFGDPSQQMADLRELLAHGFSRAYCTDCHRSLLVAHVNDGQ